MTTDATGPEILFDALRHNLARFDVGDISHSQRAETIKNIWRQAERDGHAGEIHALLCAAEKAGTP